MGRNKRKAAASLEGSFTPSEQSVDIEKLMKMVETLSARVDRLADEVSRRSSVPLQLSSQDSGAAGPHSQVMSLCSTCGCKNNNLSYGAPPSWMFKNSMTQDLAATRSDVAALVQQIDLIHSASMIQEKSLNAVVENLPEPSDIRVDKSRPQRSDSDYQIVKNLCRKMNISEPQDVWRHPSKSTRKSRPLKVHFTNSYERNTFIRNFRRTLIRSDVVAGLPRPSARRDMSPMELQLLYILRKEAHDRNQAAGALRFYVEDLRLMEKSGTFTNSSFHDNDSC